MRVLIPCITIVSGPFFMSVPTHAQEANVIEEIVVTARKRDESLHDTPVVASVLSKLDLERYNLTTFSDIASQTPGLIVGESATQVGGAISLRGVSTGLSNPSFEQAVSVVVDNIAINHGSILRFGQIDSEVIEILKGPQALFFGKNSPGGVISVRTSDPTDEFMVSLKGGYEKYAREEYGELVVSGPLADGLGARLVGYFSNSDGYYENTINPVPGLTTTTSSRVSDLEEVFLRATLLFDKYDSFSARTKLSYAESEGNHPNGNGQKVGCPFGVPQTNPLDDCRANRETNYGRVVQPIADADPDLISRSGGDNFSERDMLIASHEMEFMIGDSLVLTSVTGYLDAEDDVGGNLSPDLSNPLFAGTWLTSQDAFSQELRLASVSSGPLNFMLGGFYGEREFSSELNIFLQAAPSFVIGIAPPDPIYVTESEALAFFGQLVWDVSETVEVAGGLRWSREEVEFNPSEAGVDVTNVVDDREFDDVSPEITLTWRPDSNQTYFVAYKQGFKSGGFNSALVPGGFGATAPVIYDTSYDQETVEGFEVGAKWRLLDNAMRVSGAIYSYEYEDLQLSAFDPNELALKVQNVGKSTVRGIELEMLYLTPVEGLSVRGGIARIENEFDEFISDCYSGQTFAMGCNVPVGGGTFQQDLSGETLPRAPEWTAVLGATFERTVFGKLLLSASLDVEYSDDYTTEIELNPLGHQDEYVRVNASLNLVSNNGWQISLIGRNLNDEYVITTSGDISQSTFGSGIADHFAFVEPGRTIGFQFKVDNGIF